MATWPRVVVRGAGVKYDYAGFPPSIGEEIELVDERDGQVRLLLVVHRQHRTRLFEPMGHSGGPIVSNVIFIYVESVIHPLETRLLTQNGGSFDQKFRNRIDERSG